MPRLQTSSDIIVAAYTELGAISPGEPLDQGLANWGLDKLNRLIDIWGAMELMIFAVQFQQFTLVPNLAPHTIGVAQYSGPVTAVSASAGIVTATVVNNLYAGTPVIYTGATTNTGLNNQQVTLITATTTNLTFKYLGSITNGAETGILSIIGANTADPIPTFSVQGNRPTKIIAANLIINTASPAYNIPINIRDADWWSAQRIQGLTSSYPTDLYYQPSNPNGFIFFWPVPTVNYPVQIETWTQIQQFNVSQTFAMPPAYWDGVVYSLAESLLPSMPPDDPANAALIKAAAAAARDKIMVLNERSPRISTGGDGLPSGGMTPSFDWRTGFNVGTWSGSGR